MRREGERFARMNLVSEAYRRRNVDLSSSTGLSPEATRTLSARLTLLLADLLALYVKKKNFRWHISGAITRLPIDAGQADCPNSRRYRSRRGTRAKNERHNSSVCRTHRKMAESSTRQLCDASGAARRQPETYTAFAAS